MKIIILAGYTPSLVNFRLQLIQDFIKRNYEVIACAPEYHQPTIDKLQQMGVQFKQVNLYVTSMNPFADILSLISLYKLFFKIKPDILFSYTIKPVIYGSIAARMAKIPKIYSLITGLGFSSGSKTFKQKAASFISKILYSIALKYNSCIFFQNNDDKSMFIQKKIISSNTITQIVNGSGVDLDYFKYIPYIKKKNFNFLLIARLLYDKGIAEYVESAKKIRSVYPEIVFNLIGYFYKSPNAISEAQINEWSSAGLINFIGKTDDVRPYLAECSVYVLPSYREGTPRSVLEAMAIGRPIITTDVPGCRETVVDGENGFLVKDHDPDSLTKAMLKLYIDSSLPKKMGERSRKLAEEKYDVHKVNAVILNKMAI